MGTRSLTRVIDDYSDDPIVCIYRQFDGYPGGMGLDLAEFLDGMSIVNGIGRDTPERAANGMGCLAAQLVKHLKDDIGNVYLYPTDAAGLGEEYVYTIYLDDDGVLKLRCEDVYAGKVLSDGTPLEFREGCYG